MRYLDLQDIKDKLVDFIDDNYKSQAHCARELGLHRDQVNKALRKPNAGIPPKLLKAMGFGSKRQTLFYRLKK